MVGVVVATGVDHDGVAGEVGKLEARGEYGLGGVAGSIHVERRQVAEVAVTPGFAVALGVGGVKVAAGGERGHHLALAFLGVATRILVHVEAVQAGREAVQRGGKDEAVF